MISSAQLKLDEINSLLADAQPQANGLLTGKLGIALYYFYYYNTFADDLYLDKANCLLSEVMEALNAPTTRFTGLSLASGLSGLLVTLTHLANEDLICVDPEDFLAIDQELLAWALAEISLDNTDLLYGPIGVLHYFALRQTTAFTVQAIAEITHKLKTIIKHNALGHSFFYNYYARLNTGQDKNVYFNTAHGICGILLTLLRVGHGAADSAEIKGLIEGGVEYIISFYQPQPENTPYASLFPSTLFADHTQVRSKGLAWCTGDLNVMLLLFRAGQLLQRAEWVNLSHKVLANCELVTLNHTSGVSDPYLCHGAAGVAEIFRKFHQETGWLPAQRLHHHWIGQTLDYSLAATAANSPAPWSLLDGLPGVGLALLSYLSPKNLAWGEVVLI